MSFPTVCMEIEEFLTTHSVATIIAIPSPNDNATCQGFGERQVPAMPMRWSRPRLSSLHCITPSKDQKKEDRDEKWRKCNNDQHRVFLPSRCK